MALARHLPRRTVSVPTSCSHVGWASLFGDWNGTVRLTASLQLYLLMALVLAAVAGGTPSAWQPQATAAADGSVATDGAAATRPPAEAWRRTRDGWQQAGSWPQPVRIPHPLSQLHPLVVAALMLLLSVGSLLWWDTAVPPAAQPILRLTTSVPGWRSAVCGPVPPSATPSATPLPSPKLWQRRAVDSASQPAARVSAGHDTAQRPPADA